MREEEMAYVSTIISGAACLGVLLALISAIFFLVLTAVKWASKVRSSLNEEGLARQRKFLVSSSCLLDSPAFPETRKTENGCAGPFNGTAQRDVNRSFQSSSETPSQCDEREEEPKEREKQEPSSDTVKVRELMEKMVEAMIGGPLDGITVGQLSSHSAYLDMFTKYHDLLCRELARLGFALHLSLVLAGRAARKGHAGASSKGAPSRDSDKSEDSRDVEDSSLKRLIKQIVGEAMNLPTIKDVPPSPKTPKGAAADDVESKSYEDILATAILNKVIESYQTKSLKGSHPFPKPRVRQRKLRRNDASDGDWSDTSRSDQLSLTIEEYIEEVTTALEASEDERSELSDCETTAARRIPFPESGRTVVDAGTDDENSDVEEQSAATELVTSNSSWEENWLFQKKRLRSTPNAHHPVPVPMLVPNPSEDFRALVGGVDADDLSDMSESSDFALEELTATEAKPSEASREEDADDSGSGKVKVVVAHITEEAFCKHRSGSNCGAVEADEECRPSQTNEEVQTVQPEESLSLEETSAVEEPVFAAGSVPPPTSTDSEDSLIRCRVAQREKAKWMHPVPLPDNPYSPENIEKREQQRRTNQYFRIGTYTGDSIDFPDYPTSTDDPPSSTTFSQSFSRDYYVNASKHPSGMSSPPRGPHQRLQAARGGFPDSSTEMPDDSSNDKPPRRLVDRTEFTLPSVRELAKHFTAEDDQHPNDGLQPKSEKSGRKAEDEAKYNGKQVHSLTARSISKEFREGLKNSSYNRILPKVDRLSSGGESDQGDVACTKTKLSPTPSVDLKNMKKFWEEIITANSNSTKQK